jgi:hypothetical protein
VRGGIERPDHTRAIEWRFGAGSRWRRETDGPLGTVMAHDGSTTWLADVRGRARVLELGDEEQARLVGMVLSGAWVDAPPALEIAATPEADGAVHALELVLGRKRATLRLDPDTGLPSVLELTPSFGIESWTFVDHRRFGHDVHPTLVEQRLPAGVVNRYRVESVETTAASPDSAYLMPAPSGARFDPGVGAELEVRRSANGFLLVKPIIDGREAGWFIFDTGAGTNVITAAAAESLGLAAVGTSWLGLAAGATSGSVRQAESLRIGPLTIERPLLTELDLAAVSAVSGVELAGIIGYDVLMRAVVEIEVAAGRIALHSPQESLPETLRWEPVVLYGNHVYARGRFEGRDGLFRIDTGAPQVPVIFNGPAVEELRLTESREVKEAQIGIPGGTLRVAIGPVADLELGGHRFPTLTALFPLERGGAFDDRYTTGNLGQECLAPFRVYFDYGRRRAAFVERPAAEGDATTPG